MTTKAAPPADPTTSDANPGWLAAVAELNAGNDCEAHELWEIL